MISVNVHNTAQKMKFYIKSVTFTEEIRNGKAHFLCYVSFVFISIAQI